MQAGVVVRIDRWTCCETGRPRICHEGVCREGIAVCAAGSASPELLPAASLLPLVVSQRLVCNSDMTIEAWYMDASEADQRLQHRQEPNVPVSSEELNALGVLQWSLTGSEDDAELAKIREARGYSYKDVVDIHKDRMPGYETKLKTFFEEHIHTDEEIRYILDGR